MNQAGAGKLPRAQALLYMSLPFISGMARNAPVGTRCVDSRPAPCPREGESPPVALGTVVHSRPVVAVVRRAPVGAWGVSGAGV